MRSRFKDRPTFPSKQNSPISLVSTVKPLVTNRKLIIASAILLLVLLLTLLIQVEVADARPPLSVAMTSAGPRRFPAPYGYGINVTYELENFDANNYTILYYQVQVDEGNGTWRTTHPQRPSKYEWANIHGNIKCNDDLLNLPSGANVLVRVRANYRSKYSELEEGRFTNWSKPIPATVDLWGCPGGSDTTNSCVVDVVEQVQSMENHSPGKITLYAEVPAGTWGNPEDARERPYWYAMGATKCHIQGFARTRNGTLVWTMNSKGFGGGINECAGGSGNGYGAHLFLGGVTGDRPNFPQLWSATEGGDTGIITANVPLSDVWYHPGGIQSIGQYVIVGMDGGSGPYNNVKIFKVGAYGVTEVNSILVPTKAQSVGIVNEASGRYLITVGSSSSKVIDFYRTTGTSLRDPLMHVGRWEWTVEGFADGSIDNKHIDYQNINPVRECGTNKLYLLATGRESTWFDGGEFTGKDYVHAFEVVTPIRDDPRYPDYDIQLKKVAKRHMYLDDGNFMAGASAYIWDDGSLHFYGMEHGYTPAQCSISRDRRYYPGCDPNKPSIMKIRFDELW